MRSCRITFNYNQEKEQELKFGLTSYLFRKKGIDYHLENRDTIFVNQGPQEVIFELIDHLRNKYPDTQCFIRCYHSYGHTYDYSIPIEDKYSIRYYYR